MAYTTASHIGIEPTSSGFVQAIREFVSAWMETSAAYAAYSALSTKSNAQLAARGLRRGRDERSCAHASVALSVKAAESNRCHHRCAVATETPLALAAARREAPSLIKRTRASLPAGPSFALA